MNSSIKIDSLSIYQEAAHRTFNNLGSHLVNGRILNSIHMSAGMATEVGEIFLCLQKLPLDTINYQEEFGDLLWYMANYDLVHELNIFPNVLFHQGNGFIYHNAFKYITHENLFIKISDILDIDKKALAYAKPHDQGKVRELFAETLNLLIDLITQEGIPVWEVMQKNIDKLFVRYPEKFDSMLAQNRDLVTERATLEA